MPGTTLVAKIGLPAQRMQIDALPIAVGHKMGDVVAVGSICKCHNGLVVVATKTSNGANEFADDTIPIAC
jgi:hypothetical protein